MDLQLQAFHFLPQETEITKFLESGFSPAISAILGISAVFHLKYCRVQARSSGEAAFSAGTLPQYIFASKSGS